jgi:hypothetical protein
MEDTASLHRCPILSSCIGTRRVPVLAGWVSLRVRAKRLDATTESLRHAAEDTPTGTGPGDIEKTPVFDRAGAAPKV